MGTTQTSERNAADNIALDDVASDDVADNTVADDKVVHDDAAIDNPVIDNAAPDTGADDNFKPSPRQALHENQGLCKQNLDQVVSAVPLEIRASKIHNNGSGLFVGAEISASREIYHVTPMLYAINAGNNSYCHNCLKDTDDVLGGQHKTFDAKPCTGCNVARFCSKVCQKKAWGLYHKDECKILKREPVMAAQTLMTHRLIFRQQRGYFTTWQADTLMCLESHFDNYTVNSELARAVMDIGEAIREATGNKVQNCVPWRFLTIMRTNCVPLRPASSETSIGSAFDMATAMINHSCEPNAFLTFEGHYLRLRSLKPIAAGEEVTIAYADPTLATFARKNVLKLEHFFDCYCDSCKAELREQRSLLGSDKKLLAFHEVQQEMINLSAVACQAAKHRGIYSDFEDLAYIETRLRTVLGIAVPRGKSYPEHMEPLPAVRRSLALLYLEQGQPVPALRNALKGSLLKIRKNVPIWVNEMIDTLYTALLVAGSLPPDAVAFKDKAFPSAMEIRIVTLGYLFAIANEAITIFGDDCEYAEGILKMATVMASQKPPPTPGMPEFEAEFVPAQRKLMAWAGVPDENAIVITGV